MLIDFENGNFPCDKLPDARAGRCDAAGIDAVSVMRFVGGFPRAVLDYKVEVPGAEVCFWVTYSYTWFEKYHLVTDGVYYARVLIYEKTGSRIVVDYCNFVSHGNKVPSVQQLNSHLRVISGAD